jgi:hypothetical protein
MNKAASNPNAMDITIMIIPDTVFFTFATPQVDNC